MAPKFFSKFVKTAAPAATPGNEDPPTTKTTTETTETKPEKRNSRSRSGSNKSTKSGKSRQPSVDDNNVPSSRTSFQFGISLTSRNRAGSITPVPQNEASTTRSNAPTSSHRRSTSISRKPAPPPVPQVPESLKAGEAGNPARSRRSSIIAAFGGGKNKDNSIARQQQQSADATSRGSSKPAPATGDIDDDEIPTVSVFPNDSTVSVGTQSTQLGFTIIPPSVYSQSLASSRSSWANYNRDAVQVESKVEEIVVKEEPTKPEVAEEAPVFPASPPPTAETTTGYVLGSLFGRRVRTSSISSAIGGFIGISAGVKTSDSPTDNKTPPEVSTPTTAATIKPDPFSSLSHAQNAPPVPTLPQAVVDNMARQTSSSSSGNGNLSAGHEVQHKASSKSLNSAAPPPLDLHDSGWTGGRGARSRAATASDGYDASDRGAVTQSPIVDSPTAMKSPEYPSVPTSSKPAGAAGHSTSSGGFGSLLSPRKTDDDAASMISTSSKVSPEKKNPFKRSASRKPTGLAGAIVASGLAIGNPAVSPSSTYIPQTMSNNSRGSGSKRASSPPYLSKSPTRSAISTGGKSAKSPKASKSTSNFRKGSGHMSPSGGSSAGGRKHQRRPSASAFSDGASSHGGLSTGALSEYYSGNESEGVLSRISNRVRGRGSGHGRDRDSGSETDEEEDETDSSDDDSSAGDFLDDLDLEDDDMPVTGFAVASNKRNADFHDLFRNVPEGDYLIEDYGCALQREILIQGRLYISENHVCFHANIFGWITNLSIPICEIIALEKKMTAFVIPNAIQITTRQAKYSFASFLSRDTTFDVIYNIWRVSRPDDIRSLHSTSARTSLEGGSTGHVNGSAEGVGEPANANGSEMMNKAGNGGGGTGAARSAPGGRQQPLVRKATQCACGRDGKHYSETALEAVFPGSPEKIHNLIFNSGFIKDFQVNDQKLLDIQSSDWTPVQPGSHLLQRTMSYIKPLNASMGPKQTKCEIRDENEYINFDQYATTVTTTRTPDVPSGGVFTVMTRTCIMWASPISSKVIVTTQVEWSGRSFIKGIIERSAIDGQKAFHGDLERGMRAYIQEHKSEFVPEGMDTSVLEAPPVQAPEKAQAHDEAPAAKEAGVSEEERNKQRERERNRRAFQWAWDTFEGATDVAKHSVGGAMELISDAWDQSSTTTLLYFVIILLVSSNLWTLVRMGKREEIGRRKEMMKAHEREQWVQSVVMTLWDELASGKRAEQAFGDVLAENRPARPHPGRPQVGGGGGQKESSPLSTVSASSGGAVETTLPPLPVGLEAWKVEAAQLLETLEGLEARIRTIKASIADLDGLNQLD